MRKWFPVLLCLLVGSVAVAQATKTYQNLSSGYQLQYPSDWGMIESDRVALTRFFAPADADPNGPLKERVDIQVQTVSDNMSMDMFSYSQKYEVEEDYPGFKLASSRQARLGKMDAHRFEYQGTQGGKAMTLIQVFGILGQRAYVLTYLAETSEYKRHTSYFETLIRTFTPG